MKEKVEKKKIRKHKNSNFCLADGPSYKPGRRDVTKME